MPERPLPPTNGDSKKGSGLNPDADIFRELSKDVVRVTDLAAVVMSKYGRILSGMSRGLLGKPLATADEPQQRLSKTMALPILASDNISSSAYATEAITRVLALAGAGALALTMPLSLMLVGVVAIVVISYTQVIRAYPRGGGSYQAARANLGRSAGLVAAASLLVDYVLTVAVSIVAGVAALTSMVPATFGYRVPIALGIILLLVIGNLRGVRESGKLFSSPTYVYTAAIFGLICYGLLRQVTGTLPAYTPPPGWTPQTVAPLSLFLVLRAFSSGAVGLSGIEAVSNGMRVLRPSEARNATWVLVLMAVLFSSIFLGLGWLTTHIGLVPDPEERETVISLLARLLVGNGWYYIVVQISTAMVLLLAANTAFTGFPRLSLVLAQDRFMPNQFAFRGRRLSLATGIIAVGVLAAVLVIVFRGSTAALIPLYTVGVFLAFTLGQMGMVLYWRRSLRRGWRLAMVLNLVGAVVTGIVALEVIVSKFTHGAWIVALLVPVLVLVMLSIHRHYLLLGRQLQLDPGTSIKPYPGPHLVVVCIADLNKVVAEALSYARSISDNVRAVHVIDDLTSVNELRERWERSFPGVPLVIIESPYRDWTTPLVRYIELLGQQSPDAPVTIVVPEFVPKHWWEHFLHSQSALRLKMRLLSRENIVVVDIPYQLQA